MGQKEDSKYHLMSPVQIIIWRRYKMEYKFDILATSYCSLWKELVEMQLTGWKKIAVYVLKGNKS